MPTSPQPASNERAPLLCFGVFELDRPNRELRKQGRRIRLQEQPFRVLAYLLERAGQAVTREELREKLWPTSVFVDFDHGLNNAIARLREALGDAAATPHFIETVPRLGYRFIYPVSNTPAAVAAPMGDQPVVHAPPLDVSVPTTTGYTFPWTRTRAAVAAAIITAIIGFGLLVGRWLTPGPVDDAQEAAVISMAPSIAVLPFVNMSSDPESERLADGLTVEMLDTLAGIRGLRVTGQTSSFYYKGKQEPLSLIAQTLKVNHILEGSVQHSGARVRITAQLVDAAQGNTLWARTFDRDWTDILQIQEDIARAVATALQVKLLDTDELRLHKRSTPDAEAYRLYLIANAYLVGVTVKRDVATAKQLFEQALARDPQFAAAYAGLARYHFGRAWLSMVDVDDGVRLGMAAAERAIALDPESSEALEARADFGMWRYRFLDDFEAYTAANSDYRRAIQLDPSNAVVLLDYGRAVLWEEPDLAQDLFEEAFKREPLALAAWGMSAAALDHRGSHDMARARLQELDKRILNRDGSYAVYRAGLELYSGRLDDAVIFTREALTRGGLELPVWLWSLYMSLGDLDAARKALDFGDTGLARALSKAAGLTMQGRYEDAFSFLNSHRREFERSRVLDLPTARLALITDRPAQALAILKRRLPDVFAGVEPVNGRNVIPALDLVAAWQAAGNPVQSREMLKRIASFLDGPAAPRLPIFVYLRARAHALAGQSELAVQALDRAYGAGFRMTWALDLHPQPLLYIDPIDVDPAFASLRAHPRYQSWLARIKADNARQFKQLQAHDAANPAGRDIVPPTLPM